MDRQILLDLLTNILSSQGYDVDPLIRKTPPRTDLVVAKDGRMTCVQYGGTETDLRYFADAVQGAYDSLFISDEITDQMARFADRYNIRMWDRAELEIRIGKAMLAEAEDARYDLLGQEYRKSHEYEHREYRKYEPHEYQKSREHEPKEYQDYSTGRMPEIVETADDSRDALQLKCAAIRADERRAIATAKGFVSGITGAAIEFVPFWNYSYVIDTHRQYRTKTIHIAAEGSGAINALNREKHEYMQEVSDSISVPCQDYEIKSPTVAKVEAREEILNNAIESNTKNIASTSTSGGAIVTEHRTVRPLAKDIDLDMDIVYLPVWEVKGANGSIMIDAHDGNAMSTPVDDDVEFL
ncbi:MAG: hypothetical protein C4B59_06110 [Candidatus Methanogaster sp.]|uniref:Uncharacterized protein n=1 Tax=Candidatus Methanogaster sp. TaxID=3386292 RepID=A0AC61L4C0_9EURY|nr:MAG: hypothetical protein C4B59_06110 [ANME-2 cluster archaeon]